jgi:hypothetical protein
MLIASTLAEWARIGPIYNNGQNGSVFIVLTALLHFRTTYLTAEDLSQPLSFKSADWLGEAVTGGCLPPAAATAFKR